MSPKQRRIKIFAALVLTSVAAAFASRHVREHAGIWFTDIIWKLSATAGVVLTFVNQNAGAVGAGVGVIGLAVNVVFQYREDQRKERAARLAQPK
jgi:hypothetical protein